MFKIIAGTGYCPGIWGKKFKDDPKGLKEKFKSRGLVAMGNTGKNSNTSQFFFSLGIELPKLNGKHVVFGQVIRYVCSQINLVYLLLK